MVTLVVLVVGLSTIVLLSEYGRAMLMACRISPAQNISLGHHACFGGRGASDGRGEFDAPVGLGVDVATDILWEMELVDSATAFKQAPRAVTCRIAA